MKLYLCEKPSQAKDLAAILGLQELKEDHVVTSGGIVTWASGHLLQLPKPDEINAKYRKWDPADLPILPKRFKWVPRPQTENQLAAIGRLLQQADSVVIATDAEREGELIARLILSHHKYAGPLDRLWLTALDPASIKKALANPLPGEVKYPLYESALLRAKSDWLVGMNASRAASARMGGPGRPVSIGRVQTPTMAMIVRRDKEIADFIPINYTKLTIDVVVGGQPLTLDFVPSSFPPPATEVTEAAKAASGASTCITVSEMPVNEPPPALFNLSGLQQKTSAIWGWTADRTLKQAQRLYEHHKVLSYPRSDSTLLPAEQVAQIPSVLAALSTSAVASKIPSSPLVRTEVFVKDLDSAHNAIIPTVTPPNFSDFSEDERKAYLLVAKSYLAQLYPNYTAVKKTYEINLGGHKFQATAVVTTDPGWKVLSTIPALGPDISAGPADVTNVSEVPTTTTPPQHYTDGTLIGDMTSIKKFVTNPKFLDVLKPNSALGTEATRAAIIEELVESESITRAGTRLVSSPRAKEIVAKLSEYAPLLVDPAETAIWEDGLKRIETGTLTPSKFMEGIEKRVTSHVGKLLAIPKQKLSPTDVTMGTPIATICPVSNLPVRDTGKGWVFPGFSEVFCPKVLAGQQMVPEDYSDVFQNSYIPREFTSKAGNPFFAGLVYNKDTDRIEFDFNVELPYADDGPSV